MAHQALGHPLARYKYLRSAREPSDAILDPIDSITWHRMAHAAVGPLCANRCDVAPNASRGRGHRETSDAADAFVCGFLLS